MMCINKEFEYNNMICIKKDYTDDSFIHCSTQGGGCTDDRDMDIVLFVDDNNTDKLLLVVITQNSYFINVGGEVLL